MNTATFVALRDAVLVAQLHNIKSVDTLRAMLLERGHATRHTDDAIELWVGQQFKFMNLENYTIEELNEMLTAFNGLVAKYPNNRMYQRHLQKLKAEILRRGS